MFGFSSLHPLTAAVYFLSVITVSMFAPHPLISLFSWIGGMAWFCCLKKPLRIQDVTITVSVFVITALSNPLFSHRGATPLFFINGNAVTAEAFAYGIHLALMLVAVLRWFSCLHLVMTKDKWLYVFGRFSAKIALVLSTVFRAIPQTAKQAERIRTAQTAMGLYVTDTWMQRVKSSVRVYSALLSWSLEKAIDTAASMKARGYGLKGRTQYADYRFSAGDAVVMCLVIVADAAVVMGVADGLSATFYPTVSVVCDGVWQVTAVVLFGILAIFPFMMEVKEGVLWRYYNFKMSRSPIRKQSKRY